MGMGDCVVDADGIFLPPNKMTMGEMQVGVEGGGGTWRRGSACVGVWVGWGG